MTHLRSLTAAILCVLILFSSVIPITADSDDPYINTHINTGNRPFDLIEVAKTQIGYLEGSLTGTVQAYNDMTKYGKWYGLNYQPWCAMFVSWCADQAEIPTGIIPAHASCDAGMNWFKKHGVWQDSLYRGGDYTPKPGDIIYFGKYTYDSTHVGIVWTVSDRSLRTIEGNSSAKVQSVTYSLDSDYILGYGTPDYGVYQPLYEPGMYMVDTISLNIREQPSSASTILALLHEGDIVTVSEVNGKWGKIERGGREGWISLAYCAPIEFTELTFDANGGRNPEDAAPVPFAEEITVPEWTPEREGYTFLGWAQSAESYAPDYLPGNTYNGVTSSTLYALWSPEAPTVTAIERGAGCSYITEHDAEARICLQADKDNIISYISIDGEQPILIGDTEVICLAFDDGEEHIIEVVYASGVLPIYPEFTDVTESDWFFKAVRFCLIYEYFAGIGNDLFAPNAPMTRENLVVVLGKVYTEETGEVIPDTECNAFDDVDRGTYYEKYVEWAKEKGIAAGIAPREFGVGMPTTRAQIALMLRNLCELCGKKAALGDPPRSISDIGGMDWAKDGLIWALRADIMSLDLESGAVHPNQNASRAQVAQMLYKLSKA